MCLSLGGQAKDCAASSGRETEARSRTATPPVPEQPACVWLQRHRSICALGLAWSKGDVGAAGSPSQPATCGAWGQREPFLLLQSCRAPSAHALPPKPLNNGPFVPCLGTETGTEALRGSGNSGSGAQAPSGWMARGKEGHIQPGLPDRAPSVPPCAGGEPRGSRQTNGPSKHPKAGSPVGRAPSGAGASTPSPLRRWFSVPESDLGILS